MEFDDEELEEETTEKPKFKRASVFSKARTRNLKQYKDLSDEEFEDVFAQKSLGIKMNKEFEDRVTKKIDEFSKDYDLEDMNINDRLILRSLCQAIINLEDYELEEYNIRTKGISESNILLITKFGEMKEKLRNGISKMQDDLKITRRVRKADKEQSVIAYLEDLKKKAKEFYLSKMGIIICPKCGTWIASIYSLYPESNNKLNLVCKRKYPDGSTCNTEIKLTTKELFIDMDGCNKKDMLPESLR